MSSDPAGTDAYAASHFYGDDDAVFEVQIHEPDALLRSVPEAFVHDLWATQRFSRERLETAQDARITVLDPGRHNTDTGPDFLDARLRIDGTEWAGAVEIHVTSSSWTTHRHDTDPRYNSVILHVTLFADVWTGRLRRADGSIIPELVLAPLLDAPLRALVHAFHQRPTDELPCAPGWATVPPSVRTPWIHTLAAERLQQKEDRLAASYLRRPDHEQLLHERLFAALGYAKNSDAMTALARRIPLSLARSLADPVDLEALHFGVAGLLPSPAELLAADRSTADYVMDLHDRYERLRHRHVIPPMETTQWQYFRLRPANFPPLRIAQGVALLRRGGLLAHDPFAPMLQALQADAPLKALRRRLRVEPSAFWKEHVRLERASKPRNPAVGRHRADVMIVNAVLPTLLLLADQNGDLDLQSRIFGVLKRLPPEKDSVVQRFTDLGTAPPNAFEAQGLHQLYRTRCLEGRCLACPIGQHLLCQ